MISYLVLESLGDYQIVKFYFVLGSESIDKSSAMCKSIV